jgi:hypothetical protein
LLSINCIELQALIWLVSVKKVKKIKIFTLVPLEKFENKKYGNMEKEVIQYVFRTSPWEETGPL